MLYDFFNLFFPNRCRACQLNLAQGEEILCIRCRLSLPKTNYHLYRDNPVAKHFWGKTNITNATAFYFFHKGDRVQHLIHQLKYKGDKDVGLKVGSMLGNDLLKSEFYKDIDYLIPVPLHKSRRLSRGYNQSEVIAQGLKQSMNIEIETNLLIRSKSTETQTKKRRYNRYENMRSVFELNNADNFKGKHFLLVDDVITTGSTLAACAEALLQIQNSKVSIAALAFAHY
jgi:ComF family protein